MAAAYSHANGGQQPKELRDLYMIERFGVEAILNRPYLGAKELKNMLLSERIYNTFMERDKTDNVVEWDISNPDKANLLHYAYTKAVELGMIEE